MLDLTRERALQKLVIRAVRDGLIESAHDCAEGGLAVALAECCFDSDLGVTADVRGVDDVPAPFRVNATLFGESASRIVVSVSGERLQRLFDMARELNVPVERIGETAHDRIHLSVDGVLVVDVAARVAEEAWATAIERKMSDQSVRRLE